MLKLLTILIFALLCIQQFHGAKQTSVQKEPRELTECISDGLFAALLSAALEEMSNGTTNENQLAAVFESLSNKQGGSPIDKTEFDKFLRFRNSVDSMASQLEMHSDQIAKNGSWTLAPPVTPTKPPVDTSWHFFSLKTFGVFIIVLLMFSSPVFCYIFRKRCDGQNLGILDILPLVSNQS